MRFSYEGEKLPYILSRKYIPDFIIETSHGKVYVETKGYLRPEDKAKLAAIKKQYPEIDLRIVFYSFNRRYVRWAEKVKIPYAIEKIPKEWII